MENICAVILAAGQGKRIGASNAGIPKVMFKIQGKPMMEYLVEHLKSAGIDDIIAVVGYEKEKVIEYFKDSIKYAIQEPQSGTGDAVAKAKELVLGRYKDVLVCPGDTPLIKPETIRQLVESHRQGEDKVTLLTSEVENPNDFGYGRIVRDDRGNVIQIVEQNDCSPKQEEITEFNSGVYVFDTDWLYSHIDELTNENKQGEKYITDMIAIAAGQGEKTGGFKKDDPREVTGINDLDNLATAEQYLLELEAERMGEEKGEAFGPGGV